MALADDIKNLLSGYAGQRIDVGANSDLFGALAMTGDDVNEFLDSYADRFGVDMSGMLWFFHYNADEPPGGRRVLPILSDGSVAAYVPITLAHLVRAAQTKRWSEDYPLHTVRIRRFVWLKHLGVPVLAVFLLLLLLY